jgi:hypothetical protein
MWFYNAFPGHALLLLTFWREATKENVGEMIGASYANLKIILTEQTIAGFLFHQ